MKIELNTGTIHAIGKAVLPALQATAEELLGEIRTAQVMPFDTGDMQNKQTYTQAYKRGNVSAASVITDSPQARRLYYHPEYNFQTVHNPNARGLWYEPWMPGGEHESFVQNTFLQFLRKGSNL